MTSRPAVAGVDVGGTSVKGMAVDGAGRQVAVVERATGRGRAAVDAVAVVLQDLARASGSAGAALVAAGVVTPGIVDEAAGTVRYASNLDWHDVPLRELLQTSSGLPVVTGHDVRAAGLAEQRFGVARGCRTALHVPIGTGVAAAVVTEGVALTGARGSAGELGHTAVVPDGEPCPCGQRGCLEVYASGAGLSRRYERRTGDLLPAEAVVARLGADADADAVWADAVEALARGLVTATLLLDPEVVVLGGGFSRAGAALTGPLEVRMRQLLAWREPPPVLVSRLGPRAGALGALALADERLDLGMALQDAAALGAGGTPLADTTHQVASRVH